MDKQQNYVSPGVAIYRVEEETSIAVATSIGPVSAQVEPWSSGSDYTYGDNPAADGGDIYLPW
ncbi:MAG: hypothetical protein LBB85_07165 [Dysgonamonadaceae bacterium]|jgi:hypothetical protein|nr:hypothetical protein [Dysgonamonadaceae bacterium]